MDPVSALGVASAVFQFVDFSGSLISSTYRIHKSGSRDSALDKDVKTITTKLQSLNDGLRRGIDQSGKGQRSQTLVQINSLCTDCSAVADELIAVTDKLSRQGKQDLWDSFRLALRTRWSQEKVDNLQKRLDSFREQISMHLLVVIRYVHSITSKLSSYRYREAIARSSEDTLREIQRTSENLLKVINDSDNWKEDIISAIYRSHRSGHGSFPNLARLNEDDEERVCQRILQIMRYPEIHSRRESIERAYAQTFEWIFDSPPQEEKWSSFVDWLENSEPLYWITGKAGSGKSTLVKLLIDDARTIHHLRSGAPLGYEVFRSAFYFWCSGTEMQMSQEGLLRTLLHNALTRLDYLRPIIFANRLETAMIYGEITALQMPWTWTELVQAFKLLLKEARQTHIAKCRPGSTPPLGQKSVCGGGCKRLHKYPPLLLVFFIDGLDEFHGKLSRLIDFIQGLLSAGVKICVSSRPWNVFEDAFRTYPSLRLEDLTFVDIRHFVTSKLSNNPGFLPLQQVNLKAASELIDTVTTKASGVFLWVFLVTESLLEGISDGERLSELQCRLDSLPEDLEKLFERILESLDAKRFEHASQLFQIIRVHSDPLTILQLAYADEDDVEYAFRLEVKSTTQEEQNALAEIMRRRLNACCRGLIEVKQGSKSGRHLPRLRELADCRVEYLHRTVKDWLRREDVWAKIVNGTKGPFDPYPRLCGAYISYLKTLNPGKLEVSELIDNIERCLDFAAASDPLCSRLQIRFLDEVDQVATTLTARKDDQGRSILERRTPDPKPDEFSWASLGDKSLSGGRNSILHCATERGLSAFVRARLEKMETRQRKNIATSLLQYLFEVMIGHGGELVKHVYRGSGKASGNGNGYFQAEVCKELFHMLLDQGADPNAERILQRALYFFARNEDVMRVLLDHGLDPTKSKPSTRKLGNERRQVVQEAQRKDNDEAYLDVELQEPQLREEVHIPVKTRKQRMSAVFSRLRRMFQR